MIEEIENQRYKKLTSGEIVAWDIIEGFEHFVYHEYAARRTELYVGCNACHAEKEFEDAVKYFGDKND